MKLDDYGFGLFEYNGALYFKEADEGKCFDVSIVTYWDIVSI